VISIWQDTLQPCPKCGAKQSLDYRTHEDDEGHEDVEYRCFKCGQQWFADGIDS
jgi:DNA-directed RNA polymerase subunit RPC12/RpoP